MSQATVTPVIVVHGGAGSHSLVAHDRIAAKTVEDGVKAAAYAGYDLLKAGGSAVDAVTAAAVSMEDNPTFNAGRGSYLTTAGKVEMDASIMDGATLRVGGVGCIRNVANPIKVARLVMDESDHVLLVGEGATDFARQRGIKIIPDEDLITERTKNRLRTNPKFNPSVKMEFTDIEKGKPNPEKEGSHDTVGAVALDIHGNVAYATTTGGINAKLPGRCGDSPIPGCGGYSDNQVGAVSTTGHGESFIKTVLARQIMFYMEQGMPVQEALEKGLAYCLKRAGGAGGVIGITPQGDIGVAFNTEGMSWASIKEDKVSYGIFPRESKSESL